jgi:TonB family protein
MKKSSLALAALMALAPAAASAKQTQEPVRVGGSVQAPERVRYVAPVYPADAASARVSGIVILEAVVGPSGEVTDAKVLKSIPLLDEAALQAVKQWRYTPTTLNGQPVPVIMTVTVNFTIDGAATQPVLVNGAPPQSIAASSSLATEWKGAPPIRTGGTITPPERVKYVPPVYPADAQQARVTGIIILEAIIDENGNVAMTKVLKGVPMLDDAAVSAVSQWKYTPTLLNGVAVPVLMTVTVNFTIQQK